MALVAVLVFLASCGGGGGSGSQGVNGGNGSDAKTQDSAAVADRAGSSVLYLQPAAGAKIDEGSGSSSAPVAAASVAGPGFSGYGTATIDGVMSPGEWVNAARIDFQANVPSYDGGGTTPATLYIMNDGTNLYFAVKIARSSFGGATNPVLEFDNNNDGVREDGDDGFGMSVGIFEPAEFRDVYRYTCPDSPANSAGCSALDTETSRGILPPGTNDGATAATNDGVHTVIEMSHPLWSGDTLHDFSLKTGDTVGFHFSLRLFSLTPSCNEGPSCYADTEIPAAGTGNYKQISIVSSEAAPVVQAGIDIAPGGPISSINPASKGTVPVAILSTSGFDAFIMVDTTSLSFGRTGDEQSLVFCNKGGEDVNGDGLLDLMCHFNTQSTGFILGDTKGYLKGKTVNGASFAGSDQIRIVQE